MKKIIALLMAGVMAFSMAACSNSATKDVHAKSEGTMTYAQYDAAALDSEVTIEAFVQGKQSWWQDQATIYAQDKDGGYFFHNAKSVTVADVMQEQFQVERINRMIVRLGLQTSR